MRALFCLAVLALAFVGATSAQAADFAGQPADEHFAQHAVPFPSYHYEPDRSMRAYGSSPWSQHRYFSVAGKAAVVGRAEDLSDVGELSPPAESFQREWSTSRLINEALQPAATAPVELHQILPSPAWPAKQAPRLDRFEPLPNSGTP